MPRIYETDELSSSMLSYNCHVKLIEPEKIFTPPSKYLHNTIVSSANSSLHKN